MTRDEIIKYALEYSRNRGFGGPEPALPPIGGFEMAKYEPEREKHHWHSGILGIAVLAGRLEINLETLDAATLSEMASDASKTFLAGAAWGYPCPVDSAIMDLDSAVSAATEF